MEMEFFKSEELLQIYQTDGMLSNERKKQLLSDFKKYRERTKATNLSTCRVEIIMRNQFLFTLTVQMENEKHVDCISKRHFLLWESVLETIIPICTFYRCTSLVIELEHPLETNVGFSFVCEKAIVLKCASLDDLTSMIRSCKLRSMENVHFECTSQNAVFDSQLSRTIDHALENEKNLCELYMGGFYLNISDLSYFDLLSKHRNARISMMFCGDIVDTIRQLGRLSDMMTRTAGLAFNDLRIQLYFKIEDVTMILDELFDRNNNLSMTLERHSDDLWTAFNDNLYQGDRTSLITYSRVKNDVFLHFSKYHNSNMEKRVRWKGVILKSSTHEMLQDDSLFIDPLEVLCQHLHNQEKSAIPSRYQPIVKPPRRLSRGERLSFRRRLNSISNEEYKTY